MNNICRPEEHHESAFIIQGSYTLIIYSLVSLLSMIDNEGLFINMGTRDNGVITHAHTA